MFILNNKFSKKSIFGKFYFKVNQISENANLKNFKVSFIYLNETALLETFSSDIYSQNACYNFGTLAYK